MRSYLLAIALVAGGAGLVLLGAHQGWATVATSQPPLPPSQTPVSGQELVPLAGALALASLAGLAAVVATHGGVRRAVGLLLAAFGVAMAVSVSVHVGQAAVRAAAGAAGQAQGGSTTAGTGQGAGLPGGSAVGVQAAQGKVTMTGSAGRPAAFAGALLVVAGGVLVAWRGGRWPGMSSRYSRPAPAAAAAAAGTGAGPGTPGPAPGQGEAGAVPAAAARGAVSDTASMWESLNQGLDPTNPDEKPSNGA